MKKLLRKNQIIITALVVMVALAGYLSLTDEDELAVGVLNQPVADEVAETGEGEDVAQNAVTENAGTENAEAENPETDKTAENVADSAVEDEAVADISDEDVASKENAGEAVLVNNTVTGDYFEAAKLSREQTRAKNKETLLELVNSESASEAQKEKAMDEIVAMTEINEKETATENLLAAKGFEDVVVTIVDDSVDVIVNAESLTEQQIAQIEDVVKRKSECASDKIVISPVGKKG